MVCLILCLELMLDYTITLWFPCLDGLIQTPGNVARVKKSAEGESLHIRYSTDENVVNVVNSLCNVLMRTFVFFNNFK